jgi:hypothetical protein
MPGVEITRTLEVPIESLFDVISDHAGYSRFRGIQHSEIVRAGEPEPNGLGALRRIHSRPLRFEEEITHFERPVRMDYVIRDVNVPMVHEGGSIRLESRGASMTHVHWVSRWRFTTPLWRVLGIASSPYINLGFGRMLDDAARIASEPGA